MDNTTDNDINIDPKNDEQLLDEELDLEQSDTEESVDDDDELEKLRSENKKLTEIIKRKKEREQKSTEPKLKQTINNNNSSLSREEAYLIASGFSLDDIDYLNIVAKGTGLSINEAKEHPIFDAYLEKVKAEKQAKRAKLGASKGSSIHKPQQLAGLSAEDHKKAWEAKMGQ